MTKRPILLDTQLLVLLTVGVTDKRLIDRHKRTAGAYTSSDFDLLLGILGFDPRFVFCPHVAAETSALLGQHREPDRSRIMNSLKILLNNGTEIGIASRTAMEEPEFLMLGLADVAQLALCSGDTILLTADEPLFNAARARGSTALLFAEERLLRDQDDG